MKKIYLLLLIFVTVSCEKEEIPPPEKVEEKDLIVEKILYSSLPPKILNLLNNKSKSQFKTSNKPKKVFGSPRKDISAIRNKNRRGRTSYTIALKKISGVSEKHLYFDNMVITELPNNKEKIRILRYHPLPEWYNSPTRNKVLYSGSITFYSSTGEHLGKINLVNGEEIQKKQQLKEWTTTCSYEMVGYWCYGGNYGTPAVCTYEFEERCTSAYNESLDDGSGSGGGSTEPEPTDPTGGGGGMTTTPIPDEEEEENSEKPCLGDPVKDPQLAPQLKSSGLKGGLHGCTRYGGGCTGGEDGRNKPHDGIDIKNEYGEPIYAMYDGVVHSAYEHPQTGYVTRLQSVVNGEIIIYQYFHMQKERLTTKGTVVKAGDLIGRQGDSGNLRRGIQQGYAVSHVHIKVSKYTGIGDSNNYNNYRSTNPIDFLGTSFDNNGQSTTNNCN